MRQEEGRDRPGFRPRRDRPGFRPRRDRPGFRPRDRPGSIVRAVSTPIQAAFPPDDQLARRRADRAGGTGADSGGISAARSAGLIVGEKPGPAPAADAPAPSARRTRSRLQLDADGRVRHDIRPHELSNDLADWIADDLVVPGLLDPAGFEDAFVGVVRDVDPGWTAFYRNTLAALRDGGRTRRDQRRHGSRPRPGRRARARPARRRAGLLLRIPVAAARRRGSPDDGRRPRRRHRAAARVVSLPRSAARSPPWPGTRRRIPLATRSADTVFAVAPARTPAPRARRRARSPRCSGSARRRAVVAVPFEDEPTPAWGHVRTFDLDDLHALGASTGLPYTVDEHHGGWLVIDSDPVILTEPSVPAEQRDQQRAARRERRGAQRRLVEAAQQLGRRRGRVRQQRRERDAQRRAQVAGRVAGAAAHPGQRPRHVGDRLAAQRGVRAAVAQPEDDDPGQQAPQRRPRFQDGEPGEPGRADPERRRRAAGRPLDRVRRAGAATPSPCRPRTTPASAPSPSRQRRRRGRAAARSARRTRRRRPRSPRPARRRWRRRTRATGTGPGRSAARAAGPAPPRRRRAARPRRRAGPPTSRASPTGSRPARPAAHPSRRRAARRRRGPPGGAAAVTDSGSSRRATTARTSAATAVAAYVTRQLALGPVQDHGDDPAEPGARADRGAPDRCGACPRGPRRVGVRRSSRGRRRAPPPRPTPRRAGRR